MQPRPRDDIDVFTLGPYMWNVTAAAQLVTDTPVATFLVERVRPFLVLVPIRPGHALTTDLTQPVLLAPVPFTDSLFPIDGWHRIYRACTERVPVLPCQMLTAQQEHTVRLCGSALRTVPRRYSRG